jgi:hypothetical protein
MENELKPSSLFSLIRGKKSLNPTEPAEIQTQVFPSARPAKIPYPKDAGLFSLKPGDVVMTRSMFDFLVYTFQMMPDMTREDLKKVCDQLSTDLKELVK